VGIFALLDPDPDSEYGSGSTDLIEFGSESETETLPKRESVSIVDWDYTDVLS
jgi:hypothetical protein